MTDQDLPQEERELMRDILKSAAGIYANMGTDTPLTYWFNNQDVPTLRPSERIRIVLIREHDDPPAHPLLVMDAAKVLIPA